MKILLILVFVFLLVGCTESNTKPSAAAKPSDGRVFWFTPKRVVYASEQALWLRTCTAELARTRGNTVGTFNDIGANDVTFMPKANPAEEIFQECMRIKPLPADKTAIYKKWLKERISEIQSITTGTTRKKVNQTLRQNGGLSSLSAAVYSHIECDVLKVRIGFMARLGANKMSWQNEDDQVTAVSMPYLGFFILD